MMNFSHGELSHKVSLTFDIDGKEILDFDRKVIAR